MLSFNQLFTNNPKYKCGMKIESKYDCYKELKPEIFGLIRIKSTEQTFSFCL